MKSIQDYLELLRHDYILAARPDEDKISSLLAIARGTRTMKQFANETGINEATLSRIYRKKSKSSLSADYIAKIAFHAESNNYDLFCALANASGYVTFTEKKMIQDRKLLLNVHDPVSAKYTMSWIIKAALFDRGYSDNAPIDTDQKALNNSIFSGIPRYDMLFHIRSVESAYDWLFYLVPLVTDKHSESPLRQDLIADQILKELYPIFVLDAWQPELFESKKITIVVQDFQVYQIICNKLNQAVINNWFSICYIEVGNEQHIIEQTLTKDPTHYPESIFSSDCVSDNSISSENGILNNYIDNYNPPETERSIIDKKAVGKQIIRTIEKKGFEEEKRKEYIEQHFHIDQHTYNRIIQGDDALPDSVYAHICMHENIRWQCFDKERQFFIVKIFPMLLFTCLLLLCSWGAYITGNLPSDMYTIHSLFLSSLLGYTIYKWIFSEFSIETSEGKKICLKIFIYTTFSLGVFSMLQLLITVLS